MEVNKIYQGDALEVLKTFPDESINCLVTSPPYWACRDYGTEGQLGLEPTFDEYIKKLCDIFDEVKRVLRKDGTIWVNLGDTYTGDNLSAGVPEGWQSLSTLNQEEKYCSEKFNDFIRQRNKLNPLPSKCLCMIPFRFAIEMVNRGWILRNVLIWHKPNCMPSSMKDRFTVDFEYVFFFVKNKNYWFEQQFEPIQTETLERNNYGWDGQKAGAYAVKREAGSFVSKVPYAVQPRDKDFVEYRNLPDLKQLANRLNEERKKLDLTIESIELILESQAPHHWFSGESYPSAEDWEKLKELGFNIPEFDEQMSEVFLKSSEKRNAIEYGSNKRAVWTITTQSFRGSHFAVFPEDLIEPMIKAGCPEFVCKKCGKPRRKIYERTSYPTRTGKNVKADDEDPEAEWIGRGLRTRVMCDIKEIGLSDCGCNAGFSGGVVLDPFMGSGTTGVVAKRLRRNWVGIELKEEYIKMAEMKLKGLTNWWVFEDIKQGKQKTLVEE